MLIENRADYVRDWSQVVILPNAIKALSSPALKRYKIVIVTNQSAVGRGLMSMQTAHEINERLVEIVRAEGGHVDSVYMCPHKPEDLCACRKPQPGLLLQAARELSLDLQASWMIGDAWSDLLAGQAAGVRGVVLVRTGRGIEQLQQPFPEGLTSYRVFNDLLEAVEEILNLDREVPASHAST